MAPLATYEMLEPSESDDAGQHYRALRVTKDIDGEAAVTTFHVGNVVIVDGTEDWVAHLVELYDSRPPADDVDDVHVVHDSQAHCHYKATLRWFYRWRDMNRTSRRAWKHTFRRAAMKDELYFSDNVEPTGNDVDCLLGVAKVVQTKAELERAKARGENAYIVRCFYGNQSGAPPPIRELLDGELRTLLAKPSLDDQYRAARKALGGRWRPVAKGLRRNRYSPTSGASTEDLRKVIDADTHGDIKRNAASSAQRTSDGHKPAPIAATIPGQLFSERNHTARKTAAEQGGDSSYKSQALKPRPTLRKKQTVRKSARIAAARQLGVAAEFRTSATAPDRKDSVHLAPEKGPGPKAGAIPGPRPAIRKRNSRKSLGKRYASKETQGHMDVFGSDIEDREGEHKSDLHESNSDTATGLMKDDTQRSLLQKSRSASLESRRSNPAAAMLPDAGGRYLGAHCAAQS